MLRFDQGSCLRSTASTWPCRASTLVGLQPRHSTSSTNGRSRPVATTASTSSSSYSQDEPCSTGLGPHSPLFSGDNDSNQLLMGAAAQKAFMARRRGASGRRLDVSTSAVSVPKVLIRPPGQKQYEWVELWEAYTYSKVVFIKSAITEDVANNLIALTLHLDSQDKKRIYYWMNCPGGEVVPTLALYDTMNYVRSKTATVCYGLCLGMGGFLLTAGGEKGYRFAMPHSILMMHHPSGASRGQASDMQIESRELVRTRDYLSLIVSESTGQPYDRVIRELSRNKWMDPQQAIAYGMIDKVLTSPVPKMESMGPIVKFGRQEDMDVGV